MTGSCGAAAARAGAGHDSAQLHNAYGEGQPVVLDPPAAGRLAEIRVPTLVVLGDLDETGVTRAAEAIASGIPGARKVVIPGTAHMLTMEKPAEFTRLVLEFLQGLPA